MPPIAGEPVVSVVMPTLNQADFIAESVESVMTQGVERLELIVSDGGSSDGTLGVLAGLTEKFGGRLRWYSAPDSGPADAVNAAVARARAPIIGWLNSDDLYAPGAVRRALSYLESRPADVMVHGESEHVDLHGRRIGRYPSRGPDTPLAEFADGCHVCQPSAFFRREAFDALGGLDTSLKAAFDFDLWLRLFKAFPGRYGYIGEVQAFSRLHAGAITLRMRERVTLEGIEVVGRHLGAAPLHWLLTHAEELVADHPFRTPGEDLPSHLRNLLQRVSHRLQPDAAAQLEHFLANHQGLALMAPGFAVGVHADGWAPTTLDLRLRQPGAGGPAPVALVRLHCRHASPAGGPLELFVMTPGEGGCTQEVPRPGPFLLELPVEDRRAEANLVFRIVAQGGAFVPAQVEPDSTDERRLAFRVEGAELVRQPHRSGTP